MYKLILLITILITSFSTQAQKISGILKDENGNPLSAATIVLKKYKDSAIVKYGTSAKDGSYIFNAISNGEYVLYISHVGNASKISSVINLSSTDVVMKDIVLSAASTSLADVSVTAKKTHCGSKSR